MRCSDGGWLVQGGKGRTGTFCSSLMLWVGHRRSAEEARPHPPFLSSPSFPPFFLQHNTLPPLISDLLSIARPCLPSLFLAYLVSSSSSEFFRGREGLGWTWKLTCANAGAEMLRE